MACPMRVSRLLADAVHAIDNVVSHINETTAFFADQPSLLSDCRSSKRISTRNLRAAVNDTSSSTIIS